MSDATAIKIDGVSKTFKLPHEKNTSIKSVFVQFYRRRTFEEQRVLKNISLEVKEGEFFGVVGRNGSGKSTLLKLLAGVYTPTKGSITVNGKLTPFIELGVGFNPQLTGRENVFLNGALLGFSRKEMAKMYDDIVAFAELERFMDQKLRNFSSGMQVRLAFSIAIKVNSKILLLDEVLAVGDAAFQKKCYDYFRKLKKEKKTVVFISHDMNAVREYCDRAALIENGNIVRIDTADKVARDYIMLFSEHGKTKQGSAKARWGTGEVKITSVKADLDSKKLVVKVGYKMNKDVQEPIFGLSINSPVGLKIFESNTKWLKIKTGDFKKGEECMLTWDIPNIFTNGENTITAAVADRDGSEFYDWWEEASAFIVDEDKITTAVALPRHTAEISR